MKKNRDHAHDKIIAEFMGFVNTTPSLPGINIYEDKNRDKMFDIAGAKYHSSWDWLMPVVEKIRCVCGDYTHIKINLTLGATDGFNWMDISVSSNLRCKIIQTPLYGNEDGSEDLIYAVYKTVVEFIKWYNKNKNK